MVVNRSRRSILADDYTPTPGGLHAGDTMAAKRLHPTCTTATDGLHTDCDMVIRNILEALPIATKARRLQEVWPLIEQKLMAGTSHADILRALNDSGFDLSERTYKTYVYRFRKRRRDTSPQGPGAAPRGSTARTSLSSPPGHPTPSSNALTRPATFDFDPRGIPDLLK